jgi:hypothetical protein
MIKWFLMLEIIIINSKTLLPSKLNLLNSLNVLIYDIF